MSWAFQPLLPGGAQALSVSTVEMGAVAVSATGDFACGALSQTPGKYGQLARLARRACQQRYLRVYLAPRLAAGGYDDWIDVSRFAVETNLGKYTRSIDSGDFDIGYYEEANVQIAFDNEEARFSADSGYFANRLIDRSRLRIVAGYVDPGDPTQRVYDVDFEGIIDDRASKLDSDNENAQFTALSYSSILGRLKADPGAVTNGQTFQQALHNLLARSPVTDLLSVDIANIRPKVDLVIDTAGWFTGKSLKTAVEALMLAANSVMRIKHGAVFIGPRQQSATVRYQFFGKGSRRPPNVLSLKNMHTGMSRVITQVTVNETTFDADDDLVDLYGVAPKTADVGFITDTSSVAAIAADILAEFGWPKQELELTTSYLGYEVELLDLVTIDNEGFLAEGRPAVYGRAVYGESSYVRRRGGARIRPLEGYKILSVAHDYRAMTTTLKLRSVGNRPYDSNAGYFNPIYGQAVYGVSRYATLAS